MIRVCKWLAEVVAGGVIIGLTMVLLTLLVIELADPATLAPLLLVALLVLAGTIQWVQAGNRQDPRRMLPSRHVSRTRPGTP